MNVLHNFKWPLHGTSLLVRFMSSAQNLSFVWGFWFLDPVYLYGDWKLVCPWFLWKGVPSTNENRICSSVNWENLLTHLAQLLWGVNPVDSGLLMNQLCVLLMPKIQTIYDQEPWILNSSFKLAKKKSLFRTVIFIKIIYCIIAYENISIFMYLVDQLLPIWRSNSEFL